MDVSVVLWNVHVQRCVAWNSPSLGKNADRVKEAFRSSPPLKIPQGPVNSWWLQSHGPLLRLPSLPWLISFSVKETFRDCWDDVNTCHVPTRLPEVATVVASASLFLFIFRVLLGQQDLGGALEDLGFGGER